VFFLKLHNLFLQRFSVLLSLDPLLLSLHVFSLNVGVQSHIGVPDFGHSLPALLDFFFFFLLGFKELALELDVFLSAWVE
jgi:hypothetical protein